MIAANHRKQHNARQRTSSQRHQQSLQQSHTEQLTARALRQFAPLSKLDWSQLHAIARQARQVSLPPGRTLVARGRRLTGTWFLAAGTLVDETSGVALKATDPACKHPVYPGHLALKARTAVRLWWLAPGQADGLTGTVEQPLRNDLPVVGRDEQWLIRLAASPLLQALYRRRGARGWQRWLRGFQARTVGCGERIILPGEPATGFYLVRAGVVQVRHGSAPDAVEHFGAGQFFGEDAVLSGQPRNALVRMVRPGQLLHADASVLHDLVEVLWAELFANLHNVPVPGSAVPLSVPQQLSTAELRRWLHSLPAHATYDLLPAARPQRSLVNLALLLLVHRGFDVQLRQ